MARIHLAVDDMALRLTLKAMLEADGHEVVDESPDVAIVDDAPLAATWAEQAPTLVLCPVARVQEAVKAMRKGVFGYILVPLQPGEAGLMVDRALAWSAQKLAEADELLPLEEVELRHILHVLRRCKYNQAKAARVLGIGRNTLWRRLKKARESGRLSE